MARAISYSVAQGQVQTLSQPPLIGTVAGNNPTPFYLHFPNLPAPMDWVFPQTYGFSYPLDETQALSVLVSGADIPPGFQTPAAGSTSVATVVAHDQRLAYSPGNRLSTTQAWSDIGGGKIMAAGADSFTTGIVPPGTLALGILIVGTVAGLSVTGSGTGVIYYNPGGNSTGFIIIQVSTAPVTVVNNVLQDNQFRIAVTAGNTAGMAALATSLPVHA